MISHWILIYIVFMGPNLNVSNGVSVIEKGSTHYVSQTECEMHADAIRNASGSHVEVECVAIAQ